jgi:hypothetical protein
VREKERLRGCKREKGGRRRKKASFFLGNVFSFFFFLFFFFLGEKNQKGSVNRGKQAGRKKSINKYKNEVIND